MIIEVLLLILETLNRMCIKIQTFTESIDDSIIFPNKYFELAPGLCFIHSFCAFFLLKSMPVMEYKKIKIR